MEIKNRNVVAVLFYLPCPLYLLPTDLCLFKRFLNLPSLLLPKETLIPEEAALPPLTFAMTIVLLIYTVKNIIGALDASKEALVINNSTTDPGGRNNGPLVVSRFPLPSLNADI
jgi:hypothetical protein